MRKLLGPILVALVLLVGCAAILKGTSESVNFNSDPTGVQVYINGEPRGTTPCMVKLASKGTYQIEFRKPGYGSKTYNIQNNIGIGWICLDVLFTGFTGIIVDAVTGAWYTLDTKNVNMVLEKQQ